MFLPLRVLRYVNIPRKQAVEYAQRCRLRTCADIVNTRMLVRLDAMKPGE